MGQRMQCDIRPFVSGTFGCTVAQAMYALAVDKAEYGQRVGLAIAAVRDYREMSQAELARAAGITTSSLSRYEAGRTPLTAYALAELASALKVPVEILADPAPTRRDVIFAAVQWDRLREHPRHGEPS